MRKLGDFLARRWWIGVAGLGTIILVVVGILQFANLDKQLELPQTSLPEEKQTWFDQPVKDITDLGIDNNLLAKLYGQAIGLAMIKYEDAKLCYFSIIVSPYIPFGNQIIIGFKFYSAWADRVCSYDSYNGKTVTSSSTRPDTPADSDLYRVTFKELPWIQNPDWLRFVKKSYQKVGPLPRARETNYSISTAAYWGNWSVIFYDGASGKTYFFEWDGKGDPIQR